ncbi:unnamed protein product, partial [Closterium sp. Naga37s-1]
RTVEAAAGVASCATRAVSRGTVMESYAGSEAPNQIISPIPTCPCARISQQAYRGGGGGGGELCHSCRQPGHFARECPVGVVCHVCGGRGHMAAACPSDPRAMRGGGGRR